MKKLKLLVLSLILLTTVFARSEDSKNDLRKIIEPLNESWVSAIMNDNFEDYISFYAEDAKVMNPFFAPLEGTHAITAYWYNKMARGKHIESVDVKIKDIWKSQNKIYERGSYQIIFKKYENHPRVIYGSYFTIWEEQDNGDYKIKYDISNLDHTL